jgi:hypothetical protein
MGLQQTEPMTQLIDTAQKLRRVRAAHRRFLLLWALEKSPDGEPNNARPGRASKKRNLRQLRLFDDE